MKPTNLIGAQVKNDGQELKEVLEAHYNIRSLNHVGNFVFRGILVDGTTVTVNTRPVDDNQEYMVITSVTESC